MNNQQKRRVVNGTWYEVAVSEDGEVRDVLVESSLYDAQTRVDTLAKQWPDCESIVVRQHKSEPTRGSGASKFVVLPKLSVYFTK